MDAVAKDPGQCVALGHVKRPGTCKYAGSRCRLPLSSVRVPTRKCSLQLHALIGAEIGVGVRAEDLVRRLVHDTMA